MGESLSGRCMCGGVSYVIDGPARGVWNCHCERCRRWTGHFTAATSCDRENFRLLADDTLAWHRPADEPSVAYGFCRQCGSSLFWKVVAVPAGESQEKMNTIEIWAGTLDPPTGLGTMLAIYAEDASDYHTLNPDIETHAHDQPK